MMPSNYGTASKRFLRLLSILMLLTRADFNTGATVLNQIQSNHAMFCNNISVTNLSIAKYRDRYI